MDTAHAAKILGITLPTEQHLLKSSFRKAALFMHPDVGGDPKAFRELRDAYEFLEKSPGIFIDGPKTLTATVDGIPFEKLGKGFSLNVSAKTCDNCMGKGYRILREPRMVNCGSCHGTGWKHVPCNRCNGTGKFKKRGKVVGDCHGCKGTGEFVPHKFWESRQKRPVHPFFARFPHSHYCETCRGGGDYLKEDGAEYAVKCDECGGIGEIKLFNPVLPRGLLMTKL